MICSIGHRIDFCARIVLRISSTALMLNFSIFLGGWLYKPKFSFPQKRSVFILRVLVLVATGDTVRVFFGFRPEVIMLFFSLLCF